jgi:DNA end-binding protein Ku
LLDVATALIDKKTSKFDPAEFKDHYNAALRELIARKLKSKGKKVATEVEETSRSPRGDNVVDLMAALKKSLETGSGKAAAKAPAKSKSRAPAKKPAARKKAS